MFLKWRVFARVIVLIKLVGSINTEPLKIYSKATTKPIKYASPKVEDTIL
jgi:hypothetical protein